jgi:DNA-binding winged helix-turn-helix (wHTH) protein
MSDAAKRLVLDAARRTVRSGGGEPIRLRAKSFELLTLLAEYAYAPVTRGMIAERIWPGRTPSDDSISHCVVDVRHALHDADRSVVQTIPGVGYRLVAEVERVGAEAPRTVRPVISVRPFATLCALPRCADIASEITRDVATDLARLTGCIVVAPVLLDSEVPAETRDAQWVVTGALRCGGDEHPVDLRVSVELLEAASSRVLWSRRWSATADRASCAQETLVATVVSSLASLWSGQLATLAEQAARGVPGVELGAFDHFGMGAAAAAHFAPDGFTDAVHHLKAALACDPDYGDARASLAAVYGLMIPCTAAEALPALVAAREAAAHDAFAHPRRGAWALLSGSWIATREGDGAGAEALIREAVDRLPQDSDLLAIAALYAALDADLPDEAERWSARAISLRATPCAWYHLPAGYARFLRGDAAGALKALRLGPQGYPELTAFRAACERELGNAEAARATILRLRRQVPGFSTRAYLAASTFSEAKATRIRATFDAAGVTA